MVMGRTGSRCDWAEGGSGLALPGAARTMRSVTAQGVRHLPRKSSPLPGRDYPAGPANFPVVRAVTGGSVDHARD